MVKYCGVYITCQEVPNEIALTFTISNCPHRCKGCHSPWLQKDIGDELTIDGLFRLIKKYYDGITCVCFMGEGTDVEMLRIMIKCVHELGLKTCVYTGSLHYDVDSLGLPDYFKEGPYIKQFGGLDSPDTNQRMWKLVGFDDRGNAIYDDITSWFWRKKD